MVSSAKPRTPTASRRAQSATVERTRTRVEATVLMALRPMTGGELARATRVLRIEGIADLRPATVLLSRADAKRVAAGQASPIPATIVSTDAPADEPEASPEAALQRALQDARARGAALKEKLLTDPEMLSTAEMAAQLGMSEEGVRLKRKRHEILGLEFAKRGIRYPSWQVVGDHQLIRDMRRVFAILGDDPWRIYRFLLQQHPELGGERAIDALKRDRIADVLAAAENAAAGAFS
jgi:hypothetical protein